MMKSELHNQSIENVTTELQKSDDKIAQDIRKMLAEGRFRTLNAPTLRQLKTLYASTTWEAPILAGPTSLPWSTIPSLEEIKNILENEMKEQLYTVSPLQPSGAGSQHVASELVAHLHESRYSKPGSIYHLKSPKLGESAEFQKWYEDGMFGVTPFYITVMPANDSTDLDHHETWTLSTLLSGLRLWMVFAPTAHNLTLLRTKYQKDCDSEDVSCWGFIEEMEGAIAILQRPSQTLYIPPFCPHAVFNIETSVSAAYRIITATKLILRLRNIALYMQRIRYEDTIVQRTKLLESAQSLHAGLHHILNNTIDRFNSAQEMIKICRVWDGVKDDVRALCEAIVAEEASHALMQKFKQTWIAFLKLKRKSKGNCRLCGLPVRQMQGTLAEHFDETHWASKDIDGHNKRSIDESMEKERAVHVQKKPRSKA